MKMIYTSNKGRKGVVVGGMFEGWWNGETRMMCRIKWIDDGTYEDLPIVLVIGG